jgi:hypothetical protein
MDSCGDRWIDACTFLKVLILSILLNQGNHPPKAAGRILLAEHLGGAGGW